MIMSRSLNPAVWTVGILLMLQVGVAGQNPTKIPNIDQPSNNSFSPAAVDPANPLETSSADSKNVRLEVTNMIAAFRGFRMIKLPSTLVKTRPRTVIAVPVVSVKYPSLNFMIVADNSRMNDKNFPVPTMSIIGDPSVFSATAYSLNGQTASGAYVRRGVIAADPRIIPLGSVVQITAGKYSGVYTVLDTGRVIKGKIVDLWMPSYREAITFGRQQVKIRVLRRGYKKQIQSKMD
jgi:3D (Asp-Asp-Asp) domain-containing protein